MKTEKDKKKKKKKETEQIILREREGATSGSWTLSTEQGEARWKTPEQPATAAAMES